MTKDIKNAIDCREMGQLIRRITWENTADSNFTVAP